MKNLAITVPPAGASIQLILRAGTPSGQAVIVASDDVEIRCSELAPMLAASPKPLPNEGKGKDTKPKLAVDDLAGIHKRLTKLNPATRAAAVHSIKAMFQFTSPIADERADHILEALRKKGLLTIDANNKLKFNTA